MTARLIWIENIIGSCWGLRAKANIPKADPVDEQEHYWRRDNELWLALCDPKLEAYPYDSFSGIPLLGLWQVESRGKAKLCDKCQTRLKFFRSKDIWF